ncbi:MAG: enoyl-CoA hydratase/isomerase family protein [Rhodothermales bacterium]|nr:enoyl-CoA hydratase/isomerase family protein [Rhodothermales bacterium]
MIQVDNETQPGVCTLRLDRPEKRNALNAEVARALTAAIQAADGESGTKVIVLTGTGNTFSAGADLAALQRLATASFEDNLEDSRTLAGLFEAVYQADTPVVARVNGHAIAGGCGLAAVCDFVVTEPRSKFGFTEVRIGFVPAIISVYLLERFPESTVRGPFLTGAVFNAEEAHRLGLVTHLAPSGGLDETLEALVTSLGRETASSAVAATKRLLRSRHATKHAGRLEDAIRLNAEARGTEDCRAGVAAFLAKRPFPWASEWDAGRDSPNSSTQ